MKKAKFVMISVAAMLHILPVIVAHNTYNFPQIASPQNWRPRCCDASPIVLHLMWHWL